MKLTKEEVPTKVIEQDDEKYMMSLIMLIENIPDQKDLDGMCEWFYDVKSWADVNNQHKILRDAECGIFFSNVESRVIEYRRKLLSELKALAKEQITMEDKQYDKFISHDRANNNVKE